MKSPIVIVSLVMCASAAGLNAQATKKGAPLPQVPKPPATETNAPPIARMPVDAREVYDAKELERVLSPIALYPDPLLAQVLSAATFPNDVGAAAQWSANHPGLSGKELTDEVASANVSWDPSVQAMLAFPTVLEMMASDMSWTEEIGDAFRQQRDDVMDAVQRLRSESQRYGYLKSNDQMRVSESGPIEIIPANPEYIVVPYYDPLIVFAPPPPRFMIGSAIYFGYGVRLGLWFEPWGFGPGGFYWSTHRVAYGYPGWGRPWRYGGYPYGYAYGRSYRPPPVYPRRFDMASRGVGGGERGGERGWDRNGGQRIARTRADWSPGSRTEVGGHADRSRDGMTPGTMSPGGRGGERSGNGGGIARAVPNGGSSDARGMTRRDGGAERRAMPSARAGGGGERSAPRGGSGGGGGGARSARGGDGGGRSGRPH